MSFQKVTHFFWFCSGAHGPLLKRLPTETNKYVAIGGTVFFTGIFAALAAGYALYTVFDSMVLAMFFGFLWGLMIFNLDRFIVSSMRKRNNAWSEWKMAFPRLVFAVLLAIVISRPLELKIFEKEINRKLDEKKIDMMAQSKKAIQEVFPEIQALELKKDSIKSETEKVIAFRDKLQQEYDFERFGTKTDGTSGIVGLGSNARKKEQQLDAAQKELTEIRAVNQTKLDTLDAEIRRLMLLKETEFAKRAPQIENFDGLAARLDALHILTQESEAIKLANVFILLLFIALETAPIFVKVISLRGPYDEMLELKEENVHVYVKEQSFKTRKKSERNIQLYESEVFS
ncbi:DUF4407 domain-containing protein [Cecembia lonarensis]|uniref:DUF4407 domain-containing protein n=1 Tax=Cecembia lonarensis (strain CCUG 58316 / KCTC 22772 / LW9) TaxID=1225176 RepID=K1LC46_CECL9|nr:DUF4407 domain-containing protein [Cecembia lonarensis]EKB47953.1 hypothetical protein B879_03447 [Cecembia lonarensis LW9]